MILHLGLRVKPTLLMHLVHQDGANGASERLTKIAETAIDDILQDTFPAVSSEEVLMDEPIAFPVDLEHLAKHLSYARCSSREFPLKALIFNRGISINRWLNQQADIPDEIKDRIERRMASEMDDLLADFREHGTTPLRAALNAFCLDHLQENTAKTSA